MPESPPSLIVFYDAACPGCVRDRTWYEKVAGRRARQVQWVDINGIEDQLRSQGIDPGEALQSLHVKDASGHIHRGIDAYIQLLHPVPWLRPIGWLIGQPGLKGLLAKWYHRWVMRRLCRTGRINKGPEGPRG